MVLNYIWITFFVVAFVVALCKLLFLGDVQVFSDEESLVHVYSILKKPATLISVTISAAPSCVE